MVDKAVKEAVKSQILLVLLENIQRLKQKGSPYTSEEDHFANLLKAKKKKTTQKHQERWWMTSSHQVNSHTGNYA